MCKKSSARHPVATEKGKGVRRKGDEVFGVGMAQMEFAVEGGKVLQSIADAVEVGKDADIIIADENFTIQKTFVGGNCEYAK